MSFVLAVALSALQTPTSQIGLDQIQSRAERTQYKETSTYQDVRDFLDAVIKAGAPAKLSFTGTSTEGKPIPMVTLARPMVSSVEEAKKSGKLLIYVQANIHAGEVEGKEAALHLLRKWSNPKSKLLDKAIFLIQPIYNIDGNEKFGPQARNRPGQNGPESVGLRPNGQGFDLNRDCVKAESPEMQGVLKYIYSWDPDVVFDLHTTDGTRHGYPLTYGGPLHPNTSLGLQKYAFDEFFPTIRKQAKQKFGLELMDYGNGVYEKEKWSFETFAYEPRYVTNYGGLRGAMTILSEAMVYEPFDIRVRDTERFVELCVAKLIADRERLFGIRKRAVAEVMTDKQPKLATRFKLHERGEEKILLEKDLSKGGRRSGPVRDMELVSMPVFDRFIGTKFESLPTAYLLPAPERKAVDQLRLHGVEVEQILEPTKLANLQWFVISDVKQATSAFQGHKLITLDGTWNVALQPATMKFLIRTQQPLGRLVFDLMEPSINDGLTAWGFFGEGFKKNDVHPVYRTNEPIASKTWRIP